jgi:hypothetical protein
VIHYSCDRCKRIIDSQDELRFVVRMEVRAAMDMSETDDDHDDRDHLLEVHEILETMDDLEDDVVAEDIYQQLKFDLCPECYRRFMKAPVGKEATAEFNFSQN